jgi:ABC-2 type transport system permease protein
VTLWRLEWMRLVRTKRWIALFGVFMFFGLLGPFTARYLGEIVSFAGGELEGATIEFPPPVPADGMAQYVSNAMQLGTLVAVVVVAGSLAFDSIPEMGVFLRTRASSVREILLPRVVVTGAAVLSAFVLGALAAWYETWVLIGDPGLVDVLLGTVFGSLFLVFVVSLVAAIAGRASSVLGTVMTSMVVLVAMPIFGIADEVGRWLPSRLSSALGSLPAGAQASDYVPSVVVTLAASAFLLWLAVRLAGRREL